MKKRLFLSAALLLIGGALAMAQISTGEPSAVKIKTGNRPDKGTFGLFLGAGVDFGTLMNLPGGTNPYVLPLVNVKYFFTDKLEGRIGLDLYRQDINAKGKGYLDPNSSEGDTYKIVNKAGNGAAMLWPGIAYHFTNKNILDVYVGAELPFGLVTDGGKVVYDDVSYRFSTNSFNIGLGAFIGLQAFIGNLPLAIGLEYGFYGQWVAGQKTKSVLVDDAGKHVWYNNAGADNPADIAGYEIGTGNYEKLSVGNGFLGNQLRLTLSYYFK